MEITPEQYEARTAAIAAEAAGWQAQAAALLKAAESNQALAASNMALAAAMAAPATQREELLSCLHVVAAARVENEVGALLTAAKDMLGKLPP